jgi:hypothetical protein
MPDTHDDVHLHGGHEFLPGEPCPYCRVENLTKQIEALRQEVERYQSTLEPLGVWGRMFGFRRRK